MALFSSKIDEHADPKVQIQQAIEEAQTTHRALSQQAAQVIGNQRQLEMRLNRQLADIEKLQVNVRQALTLADQATGAGDAAKATEYNNAAEAFAAQLVTAEQSVEDLKALAVSVPQTCPSTCSGAPMALPYSGSASAAAIDPGSMPALFK